MVEREGLSSGSKSSRSVLACALHSAMPSATRPVSTSSGRPASVSRDWRASIKELHTELTLEVCPFWLITDCSHRTFRAAVEQVPSSAAAMQVCN